MTNLTIVIFLALLAFWRRLFWLYLISGVATIGYGISLVPVVTTRIGGMSLIALGAFTIFWAFSMPKEG